MIAGGYTQEDALDAGGGFWLLDNASSIRTGGC